MKAARYDFTIPRAEDWTKTWTFPFDLTGWTAELILGSTTTLKQGAGLVINGSIITTTMDKVKTAVPANYHQDAYQLRLINPEGKDATYIKGQAEWRTQ